MACGRNHPAQIILMELRYKAAAKLRRIYKRIAINELEPCFCGGQR